MKQAILTLLSSLITSLKQESARYHSLILPLIQGSVHPESVSLRIIQSSPDDNNRERKLTLYG